MSAPRLLKPEVRTVLSQSTIVCSEYLSGDPHAIIDHAKENFENGQLIFHIGTGGGIGRVEWKKQQTNVSEK